MINWLQVKLDALPSVLSSFSKSFKKQSNWSDNAANDFIASPVWPIIDEITRSIKRNNKILNQQRLDRDLIALLSGVEREIGENPLGALGRFGELFLPIWSIQGELINIQLISEDGRKSLLKKRVKYPGYISVCEGYGTRLVICQDWESACTLSEFYPGYRIVSAQRPDQLFLLTAGFRSAYPNAEIIIASSDDRCIEGNPSLARANQIAELCDAEVIKPEWPENAPKRLRTFNDLHIWLIQRNSDC